MVYVNMTVSRGDQNERTVHAIPCKINCVTYNIVHGQSIVIQPFL